jgi:hypothetical protein
MLLEPQSLGLFKSLQFVSCDLDLQLNPNLLLSVYLFKTTLVASPFKRGIEPRID